jgi:3-mercaptopyruvate sulfurtransferase SseA
MNVRRSLVVAAIALGALAALTGDPRPPRESRLDVRKLAGEVAREEDHVTARQLATWIRERKSGLRVLDVRSPREFAAYHIPGAQRESVESLVTTSFSPEETLVLYSEGGAHAAQAWVLLRASGHERVFFLRGGLKEWTDLLAADREVRGYFGIGPGTPGQDDGGC